MLLRAQHVALQAHDREVGGAVAIAGIVVRSGCSSSAEAVAADAARRAVRRASIGTDCPVEADAPAVEQDRRVAGAPRCAAARRRTRTVPWFSRKNSRFSGKNRLKRVRLTCCSSASTCAKSVL